MFCKKCGQELPNGTKFCTKCGTPTIVMEALQMQQAQNLAAQQASQQMAYQQAQLALQYQQLQLQQQALAMQQQQMASVARCPRCGSTSLSGNKKGFGVGKAVVGATLVGPIGLVAGNAGAKKVIVTCMNCGYKFKR